MKKEVSIVVLLLVLINLQSCSDALSKSDEREQPHIVPIKTAKIIRDDRIIPIISSGKLKAALETKLAFRTGGYIKKIYYKEGQFVPQGVCIAELNTTEIAAQFQKASSALKKAERDLKRTQALMQDSAITEELYLNAQTAYNVAESDYKTVQFNLKHSAIYAPVSGKILKKLVEDHEFIAPGHPALILGAHSQGWTVTTSVSDKEVILISLYDSAQIRFDALPENLFPARVTAIAGSADPYTGMFTIELTLHKSNTLLRSGLIGHSAIFPNKIKGKYSFVPIEALLYGDNTNAYLLGISETDSIIPITAKIAGIYDGLLAISTDLKTHKEVIVEGGHEIQENSIVKRFQ